MYDVSESFADLKADKIQQSVEASMERKCGTCRFFVVRPNEVEIAQIARPMYRCGPGSQCSGGPVRGMCNKWKERGVETPQMESTQLCALYKDGGPVVLGTAEAGSFQRGSAAQGVAYGAAQDGSSGPGSGAGGLLLALGVVAGLAAAGPVVSWWKNR